MKEASYKTMVRPILEYGSSVWDPYTKGIQDNLEKVQNREARFVTREEDSMTGILEQLKWESLQKRRKDNRRIFLYKGLKGKARIPTCDLIPKTRRCRNQHSMAFQIPSARFEAYKYSFLPQTNRDWNVLPDFMISTAELSDDCVSKFSSLVRAGDKSPQSQPLVKNCQSGVSPVNYADYERNWTGKVGQACEDIKKLCRKPRPTIILSTNTWRKPL